VDPGPALREAFRELIGRSVTIVTLGPEPGYPELVRFFGGDPGDPASRRAAHAAIADAAGHPTARAVARSRSRKDPAAARRERQSFLRNLQRWADGSRSPDAASRRLLKRVGRREERKRRRMASMATVLATARAQGVTTQRPLALRLVVSSDDRWRYGLPAVHLEPLERTYAAAAAGDWDEAAFEFFRGWVAGYGIPSAAVLEVGGEDDDGDEPLVLRFGHAPRTSLAAPA
jgi:hypothetical protein